MKRIGKRLAKILASAATIVLVLVALPYASELAARYLPDFNHRAEVAAETLSRRFEESARLETLKIEEEGVLTSSTSALFLGKVQEVVISYRYEVSLGIDLRQVDVQTNGRQLTLILPPMEVLADSLTPLSIDRKDFWYPLTDKQRKSLLENERLSCRTRCLDEQTASDDAWKQTCRMLDATVAQWLESTAGLTIRYERANAPS